MITATSTALEPSELSPDEVTANRRAWLAALRSGNYPQARRALRSGSSFCCLGVAEDVLNCRWEPIRFHDDSATHIASHVAADDHVIDTSLTSLTRTTMRRLGLVHCTPTVAFYRRYANESQAHFNGWAYTTLVGLNDTYRVDLATIADLIEDQGEDWDGGVDAARELAARRARDGVEPNSRLVVLYREP